MVAATQHHPVKPATEAPKKARGGKRQTSGSDHLARVHVRASKASRLLASVHVALKAWADAGEASGRTETALLAAEEASDRAVAALGHIVGGLEELADLEFRPAAPPMRPRYALAVGASVKLLESKIARYKKFGLYSPEDLSRPLTVEVLGPRSAMCTAHSGVQIFVQSLAHLAAAAKE